MYVLHGRLVSTSNINIQCVLCCSVLIHVLVCLGRRSTANKTVLTCLVLWGKSAKFTVHRVHEDLLGRPTFGDILGECRQNLSILRNFLVCQKRSHELSVYPSSVTHIMGMAHLPFSHCYAVLRLWHSNTSTIPSPGGCLTSRLLAQTQNSLELSKSLGFVTRSVTSLLPLNLVLLLQFSVQVSAESWQPVRNMDLFAFDKISAILVEACFKMRVTYGPYRLNHLWIHIQSAWLDSWGFWKRRCLRVWLCVEGYWNKTVGFQSGESVFIKTKGFSYRRWFSVSS